MDGSRIAVVGGGVAGLTAAYELQSSGFSVTLYERESKLGGRAGTDELDGYAIDFGAQLVGSMYERFLSLARQVGLGERLRRVSGLDALYRRGRVHEVIYGSAASMALSGGVPLSTKARLGARYVPFLLRHGAALEVSAPERAAAAGLDRESIAAWGMREMDRAFVDSLATPQLAAYYGSTAEETSAGFYHILARHGMDVSLYGISGGIGLFSDSLAAAIRESGGEIRTASPVRLIELSTDSVGVTCDSGTDSFSAAVSALPAPVLDGTVTGLPRALEQWLAEVRYRPALTLALLLERPLDVRYFGLSFSQGETLYTAALCVQENKDEQLVPAGRGLLVAIARPEGAAALLDRSSREVLEHLLPEIDRVYPGIERHVSRARVYRWSAGMPTFFPGYLQHLGRFRGADLLGALPFALAGDYLYGPSVEGAVLSGRSAAARLQQLLRPS